MFFPISRLRPSRKSPIALAGGILGANELYLLSFCHIIVQNIA